MVKKRGVPTLEEMEFLRGFHSVKLHSIWTGSKELLPTTRRSLLSAVLDGEHVSGGSQLEGIANTRLTQQAVHSRVFCVSLQKCMQNTWWLGSILLQQCDTASD